MTAGDLARHAADGLGGRRLRVLVSGASGLVGRALAPFLTTGGHEVVALSRSGRNGAIRWDPARGELDAARLEGFDAVVHLAGENIAGRWTRAKKDRIRASRVDGTRLLAAALAGLERPPRALVCASAVGFYGDRGDERLDESSAAGPGFLPDVCKAWEAAADPARAAGIRVVHVRLGMVLTPAGGALGQMLTPFRLGLGGPVGSGDQHWSWIARDDVVDVLHRALADDGLAGAVNAVAPDPPTSRAFARTLGRVLRRPAVAPLPAFVVRGALGEMGRALLLASTRVEPARLLAAGHAFRHPDLEGALRHLLGRA